jgi:phosphoribosyl 1,2-cyclic phosphodiesterase
VRGAIPCPGSQTARYGGNTACVELRCGGQLVILDGGSGLRPLGEALMADGDPVDADVLFSHFHIDHLIGLPFFLPAYDGRARLRLWGARSDEGHGLADALARLMSPPLFPVGPDALQAQIDIREFARGDTLSLSSGIAVRSAPLNHPGGATGYRVEHAGRAVAYLTDTEHHPDEMDPHVLALARRADIMIYDANYTDTEYPAHVGWGHSTWQQAVRLADAAEVGTLVLFHHDPGHDDSGMDSVAAEALAVRPRTIVAQEGCVLTI